MTTGFSIDINDPSQSIHATLAVSGDNVTVSLSDLTYNLHVGGLSALGLDPTLASWHQHAVVTDFGLYGLTAADFQAVATNLAEQPAVFDAFNDLEGDGSIGYAWPPGFVNHWTDVNQGIVANQTIWYYPVHVLHPGLVTRFVVADGESLKLVTLGVGNGAFPTLNNFFGPLLWKLMDSGIAFETLNELGRDFPDGDIRLAPCFAAGTPILLADGCNVAVEDIAPGMRVAAFDEADAAGTGPLQHGRVTRLIPGLTEEWIVLDDGTRVTPGHRYLCPPSDARGPAAAATFMPIDAASNDNAGAGEMRVAQSGGV